MKKRLLFILLLLIPFIVNASDINDLHYKWSLESKEQIEGMYITKDHYITYTYDVLTSTNKKTGEKKSINITDSILGQINNNIIVFHAPKENNDNGIVYITVYDEELNELNTNQIEKFQIIDFKPYKKEGFVLVGNQLIDNETNLVALQIDKNGQITNTDKHKINGFATMKQVSGNGQQVYVDFNNNYFQLDGNKIKPYDFNINSDGTYMFLTNDRLYKYSSTGEVIDSVEIPNGKGTRMAKKGNYYYVATGKYTTTNDGTSIQLMFYLIDEDLNIIKTAISEESTNKTTDPVPEEGYNDNRHDIYIANDKINCFIFPGANSRYSYTYYFVSEDLEVTGAGPYFSSPYRHAYSSYYVNSNYLLYFNDPLLNYKVNPEELYGHFPTDITNREYQKINEKLGYLDEVRSRDVFRDGKNFVVFDTYEKCEGEACTSDYGSFTVSSKVEMYYLDSKYNKVFQKTIVDWHQVVNNTDETAGDYNKIILKKPRPLVKTYEDHLVVAVSAVPGNILQIYDREGNLVRDFSEEINKYEELFVFDMETNERGIYLSLSYAEDGRLRPHLEGVYNQYYSWLKYSTYRNPEDVSSVIVHISPDYIINKKTTGNGTITATLEKAEEGTAVRFTVTPDPGYVLSMVKVIDANGNVLIFTDNTFVMPSSDVTIEAIFVPINPKTGDIAIFTITIIAIISASILLIQKKKLNFLK